MLRADIDWRSTAALLARDRRVQVPNFLQPEAAEDLRRCLSEDVPWTLALRSGGESRTIPAAEYAGMSEAERRALLEDAYRRSDGRGFSFAYESYMMVRAYLEGRDPGLLLHRVLEFFNSPDYLAFARALTGQPQIRRIDAQATRYRPGHFLRRHNDVDAREGRIVAYVLNLSRTWRADWGGLLTLEDDSGRVFDTLMPRYNALNLFLVPTWHHVSLVAPYAEEDRLAITGWMLAG